MIKTKQKYRSKSDIKIEILKQCLDGEKILSTIARHSNLSYEACRNSINELIQSKMIEKIIRKESKISKYTFRTLEKGRKAVTLYHEFIEIMRRSD